MKKYTLIFFFMAISAICCNIPLSLDDSQNTPGKSSPPTVTATPGIPEQPAITPSVVPPESSVEPPPEIPHGQLIYSHSLTADWPPYSNDRGSGQTIDAGYEMTLISDEQWGNWIYSSVIEEEVFFATVNISFTECNAETCSAGLLFQYSSPDSYKYFIVSQSGAFSVIEKRDGAEGVLLIRGEIPEQVMNSSDSIIISMLSVDRLFTFYVNGVQVGKVEASSTGAGDIGLYVQTTGGRTTAVFSDIAVYEPN